MRDLKILSSDTGIDIDIVNGQALWLDEASQTQDMRAALACYACKGTVPGLPDYGVSWAKVYDRDTTTIDFNNELQQQIDNYVGSASEDTMLEQSTYQPLMLQDNSGMGVLVYRGGM